MGKDTFLIFINTLGSNFKNETIYEFIFSKNLEIEAGDDWEVEPASTGNPTPPPLEFIVEVGVLKMNEDEIQFDVIQNSDTFCMYDAVEKIIALAWESEVSDQYDRLVFHYGDTKEMVLAKLYERDIALKVNKI